MATHYSILKNEDVFYKRKKLISQQQFILNTKLGIKLIQKTQHFYFKLLSVW